MGSRRIYSTIELKVRFGYTAVVHHRISSTSAFGGKAEVKNAANQDSEGPESANTVDKLCFEMSGDFICDLSGIAYCRYEEVVGTA